MGSERFNPGDRRGERGSLFVCAFCNSPFRLAGEDSLSIRYEGRVPQVECPECADVRRTGEAPNGPM